MAQNNVLESLDWPDDQVNPSGIKSKLFYMRKGDVEEFPEIGEDNITYEGDFTLREGAHAIEIYSTQGKGKLDFESEGEKDCKAFTNKGSFSYPDLNDAAIKYARANLNSNGIYIAAYYLGGGKVAWAVLGHRDFDPEATITGTTGAKIGEEKGLTIEISAPDYVPLPRYTGTITLKDRIFDCKTNKYSASKD